MTTEEQGPATPPTPVRDALDGMSLAELRAVLADPNHPARAHSGPDETRALYAKAYTEAGQYQHGSAQAQQITAPAPGKAPAWRPSR